MCHKSNFDPEPSRNGRHGTEESDRRRRARLRGLCNMFSSFVRLGSGGSTKDDFVAIFPPPQRKHEKEFRDRAFDAQIFMLCKIAHFIKSPESSVACVPKSGGKILHFRLRSNGNKFPLSDDGKTIRPSSYSACVPQKFRASLNRVDIFPTSIAAITNLKSSIDFYSKHGSIARVGRWLARGRQLAMAIKDCVVA